MPLTAGLGTGIKGHTLRETRGAWQGKGGDPQDFVGIAFKSSTMEKRGITPCLAVLHWPKTKPEVSKEEQEAPTPWEVSQVVT